MTNENPILILEQDEGLQHLLEAILRRDGFDPVFASDGRTAKQAVRTRTFVAFIVDVSLGPSALEDGARRGIGFLHYLQRQRPALLPRVVVVSGLAPKDVRIDLAQVGRFLRKPFDIDELRDAITGCARADASAAS